MRIGQLAEQAGVGVETVRFYQSRGLIVRPIKPTGGGYRDYPDETVERIRFIRRAQKLGFSLQEIARLLALGSGPDSRCEDVRERAQSKLEDIERRIAELNRIGSALRVLIDHCPGAGPTRNCTILGALRETGPESNAIGNGGRDDREAQNN